LGQNLATLATFGEHLLDAAHLTFDTSQTFPKIFNNVLRQLHHAPPYLNTLQGIGIVGRSGHDRDSIDPFSAPTPFLSGRTSDDCPTSLPKIVPLTNDPLTADIDNRMSDSGISNSINNFEASSTDVAKVSSKHRTIGE
jgi:hypothetical protein